MPPVRGTVFIHVFEGRSLSDLDRDFVPFSKNLSDPWLEILLDEVQVLSTSVVFDNLNPKWNAKAVFPICHDKDYLILKVWDDDVFGRNLIGEAEIAMKPRDEAWERKEWVSLKGNKGEVHLWIKFIPVSIPNKTLKSEPLDTNFLYFKPKMGGSLQLYQDAHSHKNISENGMHSKVLNTAFEDMAYMFEKAKKFIYISGWSVWTNLQMRRNEGGETIGELLKRRADDGVRVLIMTWSERISSKLCRELFGTHYLETEEFFKNTNVVVSSVERRSNAVSDLQESIIGSTYTHHMKIAIADCPKSGIVGFVGGLDLTDGRWDTPEHAIWESLLTEHRGDFYNGFVGSANPQTGPREPWHDIHSKLEGPCVLDLLAVFEERWKKEVLEKSHLLFNYVENLTLGSSYDEKIGRKWCLQMLRTSDSSSTAFKPAADGLSDIHGGKKDCSYQHGIVSLIRSSKKFIYIENQYFLGSAFAWNTLNDTCTSNIIPVEIVEQILLSLTTDSPIRVYIALPLCPEGDSKTLVGGSYMGDIVHWQYLTIQMMYRKLSTGLQQMGLSDHPEEYLIFLSLCRKIKHEKASTFFPKAAQPGTEAFEWQKKSRFIIYVHSKMILVDNSRVLLGSANFNDRSMDGSRDTEAGIAASEVEVSKDGSTTIISNGEICKFRESLWNEHTGGLSDVYDELKDPSSKECILLIKKLAEETLRNYINDDYDEDIIFRFLKYPLKVEQNGVVIPYEGIPNIPDFGIPVTGKRSYIPTNVTT